MKYTTKENKEVLTLMKLESLSKLVRNVARRELGEDMEVKYFSSVWKNDFHQYVLNNSKEVQDDLDYLTNFIEVTAKKWMKSSFEDGLNVLMVWDCIGADKYRTRVVADIIKQEFLSRFGNSSILEAPCAEAGEAVLLFLLQNAFDLGNACDLSDKLEEIDNDLFFITSIEAQSLASQRHIDFINAKLKENYGTGVFVEKDVFEVYQDDDFLKTNIQDNLKLAWEFEEGVDDIDDMYLEVGFDTAIKYFFDEDASIIQDFLQNSFANRDLLKVYGKKVNNVWLLDIEHHAGNEMFDSRTQHVVIC